MAKREYYKGVTVQYKGETTELSAALGQIRKDLRDANGASKALNAALRLDPKSMELVADKAQAVTRQIEATRQRLDALRQGLAKAEDPAIATRITEQAHIAEAQLKSLEEQLTRLNAQAAKGEGFGSVVSGLEGASETLGKLGSTVSSVGDSMTKGVTAPIVALGALSVSTAATIDTALTGVRKTVDGTEQEYQALKDAAIEYSKTNAVTAEQILDVQALGAQLGYAKDELEMMGRVGTGLDIATDMNAEQATTELAQFANITGMAHDASENYASTVVALGNNMATTESRISGMAQRVAAAGTQVGMSEADILGFSAALASMGIEAEAGGSNISKIMSQVDKDVAKGGAGLATWAAAAGMSADAFAAKWGEAPVEALQALFAGMGEAAEAGGNLSLMLEDLGIKSNQAVDVAKRMTNGHELLADAIALANDAWRENTALAEEVANKNDSLEARMQMLQNRVTAMLEKVGKPVADALIAMVDAAEPVFDTVEGVAEAFSSLDKGTQQMIVSTAALTAAIGPVLSVGGRVLSGAGGVTGALGKVGNKILELTGHGAAAAAGAEAAATSAAGAATVLSGPVVAGIALASAGIVNLVATVSELQREQRDASDATTGLTSAMSAMDEAASTYLAGVDAATGKTTTLKERIDDAISSQAELARSMREEWAEIGQQKGSVEGYVKQIEELAGKSDLTAADMAVLKNAVEQVNGAIGSSISVVDEQTGKLSLTADQIREVAQAWSEQQEVAQHTEDYNNAIENQRKQHELLEKAIAENDEILKSHDATTQRYIGTLANGSGTVVGVGRDLSKLEAAVKAADDAVEQAKQGMAEGEHHFSSFEVAVAAAGMGEKDFADLTEEQLEQVRGAFDHTVSSIKNKLSEIRDSVGTTGSNATGLLAEKASEEAIEAQKRENSHAVTELQRSLDAEYKARSKAYEREATALSKALDAQYKLKSKEFDRQNKLTAKANEREVASLTKSLDAEYKAQSKAYDQQAKQLSKALDARLKQISDALDKEYRAAQKASQKYLQGVKRAQSEQTDAYRKATDERIAEIDREYAAKQKLIDSDRDGATAEIDEQIRLLNDQTDAERRAIRDRQRAEKVAELEDSLRRAQSDRTRAEARKALDDYLAQIEQEDREESRAALISDLDAQRDIIRADAAEKQQILSDSHDEQVQAYRDAREVELEALRESNDAAYEMESEREAARLEQMRESQQAVVEAERERNAAIIEMERERDSESLVALKESQQAQVDALRESQSEQAEATREWQSEQLEQLKEANQSQVSALRESQQQMLDALKQSQQDQITVLREAQADMISEMKSGGEQAKQEVASAGEQVNDEAREKVRVMGEQVKAGFDSVGSRIRDALPTIKGEATKATKAVTEETVKLETEVPKSAGKGVSDAAKAISQALPQVQTASGNFKTGVLSQFEGIEKNTPTLGHNAAVGWNSEFVAKANEALRNVHDWAQNVINIIASTHQVSSPARKFAWIADMDMAGYRLGWKRNEDGTLSMVRDTADAIVDAMDPGNALVESLAAQESAMADQSRRLARIVERGFAPDLDLATRYDASLSYGRRYAHEPASRAEAARPPVTVNLTFAGDVRIDSEYDAREMGVLMGEEAARALAAAL